MNTMIQGTIARADLVGDLLALQINPQTLKNIHEHVWGESLEWIVHEQLKIIVPRIEDVDFIYRLVDEINKVKKINTEFFKALWTYELGDATLTEILNNLEHAHSLINEDVDIEIVKNLLCNIVNVILKAQPVDLDKLTVYKEELKKIISGE